MGKDSKIEWTHHTFNPWRGCTKVSEGCRNCYAEQLSGRNTNTLGIWGPQGTRVVAAESAWKEPLKWDKAAKKTGERHRVFCASLADVFENWNGPMSHHDGRIIVRPYLEKENIPAMWQHEEPETMRIDPQGWRPITMQDIRNRLFALIDATPNLNWLLLTKRPENVEKMLPWARCDESGRMVAAQRQNIWIGTSIENQQTADERIPHLLKIPAKVRFLSCEPLLGLVDLSQWLRPKTHADKHSPTGNPLIDNSISNDDLNDWEQIYWVIVGGESGHNARPMHPYWAKSLKDQCVNAGVPYFMKQLGGNPVENRRIILNDGEQLSDLIPMTNNVGKALKDKKGGDWDEWPEDLRIREFPNVLS